MRWSSCMIDFTKALKAVMSVILMSWSVMMTSAPDGEVFTTGRLSCPNVPPEPTISTVTRRFGSQHSHSYCIQSAGFEASLERFWMHRSSMKVSEARSRKTSEVGVLTCRHGGTNRARFSDSRHNRHQKCAVNVRTIQELTEMLKRTYSFVAFVILM